MRQTSRLLLASGACLPKSTKKPPQAFSSLPVSNIHVLHIARLSPPVPLWFFIELSIAHCTYPYPMSECPSARLPVSVYLLCIYPLANGGAPGQFLVPREPAVLRKL